MIELIYRYKVEFLYDQAEALVVSFISPCLRNNYHLLYALNHKSFLSRQSFEKNNSVTWLKHVLLLCSSSFSKTAFPLNVLHLQSGAFSGAFSSAWP